MKDKIRVVLIGAIFMLPCAVSAQQLSTCSSPAFEARLVAAVARGEAQLKSLPANKVQDYARCYASTACATLTKIEFEMYALSAMTSYGSDGKLEAEYLGRMRQHRAENNSGGDKLPPKTLDDKCKREIGIK